MSMFEATMFEGTMIEDRNDVDVRGNDVRGNDVRGNDGRSFPIDRVNGSLLWPHQVADLLLPKSQHPRRSGCRDIIRFAAALSTCRPRMWQTARLQICWDDEDGQVVKSVIMTSEGEIQPVGIVATDDPHNFYTEQPSRSVVSDPPACLGVRPGCRWPLKPCWPLVKKELDVVTWLKGLVDDERSGAIVGDEVVRVVGEASVVGGELAGSYGWDRCDDVAHNGLRRVGTRCKPCFRGGGPRVVSAGDGGLSGGGHAAWWAECAAQVRMEPVK
ncbi:hypothetical protein FPV67DRAFT_1452055 [Lyophyllum atratum]|nr:hypothetical protein FPV67DRAFT_1452055 [Lyophyllum atratum]